MTKDTGIKRFVTAGGLVVLLEESHDLPLVNFECVLRTGATLDPVGKVGLARLTAHMVRMGTKQLRYQDVDEAIDRFGAHLSIQVAPSYVTFQGAVVLRNVDALFSLLGHLFTAPAFRVRDLQKLKRETVSEIVDMRDNDRALAFVNFRKSLFGQHPYGRNIMGTRKSVGSISQTDVVRHHRKYYVASNMVLGIAGPLSQGHVESLIYKCFQDLRRGSPPVVRMPEAQAPSGYRLVMVDKPERTQSQIVMGTLGTSFQDADHDALEVANAAFGGTFTARLMREIRSKRGWSYGASSRLGHDRGREAWWMWTFPEVQNTVACIQLKLELYDALMKNGITPKEFAFAKSYLINSYAFECDSPTKRIDQRITEEVMGLPRAYYANYVKRIRAVKREDANAAIRRRLARDHMVVTVLSTASEIDKGLRSLRTWDTIRKVPWDA